MRRVPARSCSVCGASFGRFARRGPRGTERDLCPSCGSRRRHRLLWLYLERETDLGRRPARVLQFAPEEGSARRLGSAPGVAYVTADLEPGRAELTADITALDMPDAAYDVVLCVHVLEHVPDDRAALREVFRVLAPGGWAILQVPLFAERTDEDQSITDPAERLRRFGQEDHVRVYGRDFLDRVREAGFSLEVIQMRDRVSRFDQWRYGLRYADPAITALPATWEVYRASAPR